jgi:hypothetical protein
MHLSINVPHISRCGRVLVVAVLALFASFAQAVIPTPTVTGPIPSDATGSADHNYTFFTTDLDFGALGYVEQEFFLAGTANVYNIPNPGGGIGNSPVIYPIANIVTSGHPYKTRIVVRRPANPANFNGVVILEWTNVTNGYDNESAWFNTHDFLIRRGYAHVAVSAQSNGIANATTGLKVWSPVRYGTLDVTDGGTVTNDNLSYDIYSQAAQAVRSVPSVMGGMPVQIVIGLGVSQSAGHVAAYLNAIHPLANVLDGGFLQVGGQIIGPNVNIPVFKNLSESEFDNPTSDYEVPELQPDTATFHTWSTAGTAHGDWYGTTMRAQVTLRDLNIPFADACTLPSRSRIPMHYVMNAAIDHLVTWIRTGVPPPAAPLIQLNSAAVPVSARDSFGNALGGIRLPQFVVPVAVDTGTNGGPGLCFLDGSHVPFPASTLNSLYTYTGEYALAIAKAAKMAVASGFMLLEDAQASFSDASAAIYGTGLSCGPLCQNVAQFPLNPSTTILRDQVAFYNLVGGAAITATLDAATRAVATGYTLGADPQAPAYFAQATALLQQFIQQIQQLQAQGHIQTFNANFFIGEANTLITRLNAL